MAHIVSILNQKGGVGKTTTAVNLAAYLAEAGKFVLLVDIDPQANATSGLGIDHRSLPAGIYEAIIGSHPVRDLIRESAHQGLRILPSTQALAGATVELVDAEEREQFLHKTLLEVRNDYDYVIIDNPPSLGLLTVNGLVAADSVLIPGQAAYFALDGLGQLTDSSKLV